jgi:DHA2 family metal-tetracycline-proton antiporter-like MFS transporter
MGVYNLFFFMSGAFASALLGRLLDFRVSALSLNPFLMLPGASLYSDLFLLLFAAVVGAAGVFRLTFAPNSPGVRRRV